MGKTQISIESLREVEDALKQVAASVAGRAQAAALKIASDEILIPAARQKAPRQSGNLADSIRSVIVSRGRTTASVTAGTNVFYSTFVELGTNGHIIAPKTAASLRIQNNFRADIMHPGARAQPFLRPAYDENADAISARVADELRKRLEAAL